MEVCFGVVFVLGVLGDVAAGEVEVLAIVLGDCLGVGILEGERVLVVLGDIFGVGILEGEGVLGFAIGVVLVGVAIFDFERVTAGEGCNACLFWNC